MFAYCSEAFFEKLMGHWKTKLIAKVMNSFSDEPVKICAVKKNGKKWKCVGLDTGKTLYFKRSNTLVNGEDFCWVFM